MDQKELIAYLRNTQDLTLTPMQSLLAQAESRGDLSLPDTDQIAILKWLGAAFNDWEQKYPLDDSLRMELRRLKPLAASLAIADPSFLQPGSHPLHRMLDALQLSAVGWQTGLGRAGQALEKQIGTAVEDALTWFDNTELDLQTICTQVVDACERDQARAGRMTLRLVEAAQGRARSAEAKRIATEAINDALKASRAPAIIGTFLKGPWYDSAQLVLLKFGVESSQWTQMSATTRSLLDSVQFKEGDADLEAEGNSERRQRLFELVSQLPKDIKRWLLSLQHDSEAVENAMGMVEYAHMQILRKQPLELEELDLMPVIASSKSNDAELAFLRSGQWFSLDQGGDNYSRVRLVSRLEDTGELLFSNLAGIKVLQTGVKEFAALMKEGKVSAIDAGASFSRALAGAAGIESTQDLDRVLGPAPAAARLPGQPEAPEASDPKTFIVEEEDAEATELQREWYEAQRLQQQRQEAEQKAKPDPGPDPIEQKTPASPAEATVLPIGTWLGFHDGETPLLAKLAVYDRKNNNYIFVNRNGIKMRQLSREKLKALIDQDLVDILEAQSTFREEISRMKQRNMD